MSRIIQVLSVVILMFGLWLSFDVYKTYSEIYRAMKLPLLMIFAFGCILFADSFDDVINGFSVYVQVSAFIFLIVLVLITKSIL